MPAYRVSRNRRDSRPVREAASRRNVIEGALARKAAMLFDTMRQEFTMPQLTLAKADTIIDTALALGRERKFARDRGKISATITNANDSTSST